MKGKSMAIHAMQPCSDGHMAALNAVDLEAVATVADERQLATANSADLLELYGSCPPSRSVSR
jgi:hypothetical protein